MEYIFLEMSNSVEDKMDTETNDTTTAAKPAADLEKLKAAAREVCTSVALFWRFIGTLSILPYHIRYFPYFYVCPFFLFLAPVVSLTLEDPST